jgi:hypothetical protein
MILQFLLQLFKSYTVPYKANTFSHSFNLLKENHLTSTNLRKHSSCMGFVSSFLQFMVHEIKNFFWADLYVVWKLISKWRLLKGKGKLSLHKLPYPWRKSTSHPLNRWLGWSQSWSGRCREEKISYFCHELNSEFLNVQSVVYSLYWLNYPDSKFKNSCDI